MAGKEFQMAFSIGAKLQGQFGAAFKSAQNSVSALQNEIESLNKKQKDIAAYQKQQTAVEATKRKLDTLKQAYTNLKTEMEANGDTSAKSQNQLLAYQERIDKTSTSLEQQSAKLETMGGALEQAGIGTEELGAKSDELAGRIENLKGEQEDLIATEQESASAFQEAAAGMAELLTTVGMVKVVKEAAEVFKQCAQEAIGFEQSMASVRRTVGGSDDFLSGLGKSFQQLSTQIPITTDELAQIATTAGQLGIAQDSVEQFTTVMAKLATTTDLTADEAATMLAQFANITGLTDYERLGSVIAELGDATATTASKVVQMSQGMAASASQAGMSTTDIMAIAAAVGSLGIEAQAGSTSMSQLISTLYKATETGANLQEFAAVAGMSAEAFKQAWAEDAVGAMNAFITGLNDVERNGRSAIVILDELGINNVRQQKAILGLASAEGLLSGTIAQANAAWESNTALDAKASVMYETTQSKLTMMQNAFTNVSVAVGSAFTPAIGEAASAITSIVQPIAEFIQRNPQLVQAVGSAAAVLGIGTTAMLGLSAATSVGTKALAAFKLALTTIPGAKTIMLITAAVAGLAAALPILNSIFADTSKSMAELDEEFDSLNDRFLEEKKIVNMCQQYKNLSGEISKTVDVTRDLGEGNDFKVTLKAVAEADVKPTDFMDTEAPGIELTAEQRRELIKEGFFSDPDSLKKPIELTAGQTAELYKEGFFVDADEKVKLEAQQIADKVAQGFMSPDDQGITLTASQFQTLYAKGFIKDPDTPVPLTAEQTANLYKAGFFADKDEKIRLEAEQIANKVAEGFMDPNDKGVTISATAKAELEAQGFLKPDSFVTLTAQPDGSSKLEAKNFLAGEGASATTISFTAEFSNLAEMQQAVASLKSEATVAKQDLEDAKSMAADMKTRLAQLTARYSNTTNENAKSALREEMENLNTAISEQETKIGNLETAYNEAAAQYTITAAAAQELKDRDAELAGIQEALGISADSATGSIEDQTTAILNQITAKEQLAQANMAQIKADIYGNTADQAKKMAKTYRETAEAREYYNRSVEEGTITERYAGQSAEQVRDRYRYLLQALDDLEASEGFSPDSSNYHDMVQEVSDLYRVISMCNDSLTEYAGQDIDWVDAFDYIADNALNWTDIVAQINEDIADYGKILADVDSEQKTFLDNLVSGIDSGAVSIEEVEQLLTEAFANEENGAELLAAAMEYIRNATEEATGAQEEFANAQNLLTAEQVNGQIQPIIDQMNALAEAYDAAYQSAYSSMSGQFDLFGKAPEVAQTSVSDMLAGLESQKQYIEEYTANLKALQEAGLSADILAQLSDGSAESAAAINAIMQDVAENGGDAIDDLNNKFKSVTEAKETFADTVADMQTNFSEEMGKLEEQLASTVESMDMSADAATAAAATMDAFAASAAGKLGAVKAAFKKVADAAKAELDIKFGEGGYAGGTNDAEEGWHMVGEHGPELMHFNGGEQVLDANKTAQLMDQANAMNAEPMSALPANNSGSGGGTTIQFSPQYTFTGQMNADELQAILDQHDNAMRDQLEDIIDDIENDRGRRRYA